ncbi:hypothetical protein BCR32DRAFT_83819 [Anaeromyces robustus]|uniref:Uncharacterized protein n=1 Tax=Anaeromyces robustus TaxID=1754192 RepID=A0A1Y1WRY1_9FUNG|nr:hypothetical protein BCR32DRAFT_83819 [Anaeromyces robustus]|eukprot:ORX76145.1 hypothetical protein BCR32DRAFT_83819 [Anaeromyces robustus]
MRALFFFTLSLACFNSVAFGSTTTNIGGERPVVEYSMMDIIKLLGKVEVEGLPCDDPVCLSNNFDKILNNLDNYELSYNNTIVDHHLKYDLPPLESPAYWKLLSNSMQFNNNSKLNNLILFSSVASGNLIDEKMIKMIVAMNHLTDDEIINAINFFLKNTNFNIIKFFDYYGSTDRSNSGVVLVNDFSFKRAMIIHNLVLCNVVTNLCTDRSIDIYDHPVSVHNVNYKN